ncbi:MAG: Asp-tRNA(Asn)/Glu-tRNA(Gln) amidotransferase subunit GatC [Candidatus Colwellbacteria bacterium]|nr:Asp-tRNA(Asn)/Glu-tRNA(Gln) amidotransferase subunit GatC [Candidatus Colwellbacteria bacterium]
MDFDIKYFAKLARIKLTSGEEEKFSNDLEEVLGHFKQLQEIDTNGVPPMAGGTELRNVFREDEPTEQKLDRTEIEQFPETKDDFLKVPKVFDGNY